MRIHLRNSDNPYIKEEVKKPQLLSKYHKRKGQEQGQSKPSKKPIDKGLAKAVSQAPKKRINKPVKRVPKSG